MSRGHLLTVVASLLVGSVWAGLVVAERLAPIGVSDLDRCRQVAEAGWRDPGCPAVWRAARERFLKRPVS